MGCAAMAQERIGDIGGDAQFWLNLNAIYELRTAERSPETKRAVREIEPRAATEEAA